MPDPHEPSTAPAALNDDPPAIRCGMCSGRASWQPGHWIHCGRCGWSSRDHRRSGLAWRVRVALAVPGRQWWRIHGPTADIYWAWRRLWLKAVHRIGRHVWRTLGTGTVRCTWCGEIQQAPK